MVGGGGWWCVNELKLGGVGTYPEGHLPTIKLKDCQADALGLLSRTKNFNITTSRVTSPKLKVSNFLPRPQ